MQATVYRYDAATGAGSCLLDDGTELPLAVDALAGTGLRHLRPGQRVTVDVGEDAGGSPVVQRVRIVGVTP